MVKDQVCSFVDTANFLIFNSFLPPSLMLGFGIAMLMNIKQSRQRVGHIHSYIGPINKINRREKQLISMLLLQVRIKNFSKMIFFNNLGGFDCSMYVSYS
jgi:hypothetical protein